MEETYHVQLEGRTVGPYDRRTIVGMRIKKALTSDDVLIGRDGTRTKVRDLIGRGRDERFNPNRSGSFSIVQATYAAALVEVDGRKAAIPKFRGEVEARIQSDALRIAGRFRKGFGWKEDRVKIALADIEHARVRASLVDLWLRCADRRTLARVTLELFTPESAGEFVDRLPHAKPYPGEARQSAAAPAVLPLVAAASGIVLALGVVLMAVIRYR